VYSTVKATEWAKEHNFKYDEIEEVDGYVVLIQNNEDYNDMKSIRWLEKYRISCNLGFKGVI